MKNFSDFGKESDALSNIEVDIMYDTDAIINSLPFPAGAYQERTPLMYELRCEGVDL